MLKIRTAWTEKDLMYSQIEAAKRTLVVRNFPEWATAADRELTVAEALKENNLGYLEWESDHRETWKAPTARSSWPRSPSSQSRLTARARK